MREAGDVRHLHALEPTLVDGIARHAPAAREAAGMEVVLPAGYRVRLGDTVVAETLRTVLDVLEARG